MLRFFRARNFGLICLLVSSFACQSERPQETQAPSANAPASKHSSFASRAIAEGGYVSSTDRDGVPQFIWGVGKQKIDADTPQAAARYHLDRFAAALDLRAADLETAELKMVRNLRQGGFIAKWKQRFRGLEVYPSEATVLMRENFELVALTGRLRHAEADKNDFMLSPAHALAAAVSTQLGAQITAGDFRTVDSPLTDRQVFAMLERRDVQMPEAQVRQIYYGGGRRLVPAYFIEFFAGRADAPDTTAHRFILAGDDGRVLERRDLTADASFRYRVWADANRRPLEGPIADFFPHPTGVPDGSRPLLIPPVLVDMESFNTPPGGAVDPWLAAAATETLGNNVDAYSDHDVPDGYSNGDLRATVTAARTFDRVLDTTIDPVANTNQTMASVVSLFYVNNYLHDWWYDSGFNEAAGNAQRDNFGRGGVAGDVLRAEAQDNVLRGNRNNANMSTPSDGFSPRMQMYSWTGAETITLTLTPGGERPAGTAAFGAREFDLTGQVAAATPVNGCTAITGVTGRVALMDRGACTFAVKAANAQAAGAIAAIIANNVAGATPPGLGGADPSVTIPVMSLTQADGAALRAALQAGPVTVRMFRDVAADRDGSLDHMVVAHEWGHYIHHRLADCGLNQCRGMSEGWGDFLALHTMLRQGDELDAVYAAAIYAVLDEPDAAYFGIRRVPYSVSEQNLLSFRHIERGVPLPTSHPIFNFGDNAEVHNTGEVWATMMLEVYVALLRQATTSTAPGARTFDTIQRDMGDYVVAGLQMQPREASFTEARDAMLAAILAGNANDMQLVAQAFARRGLGSCAVSPPIDSTTNGPLVEGSDLRPRLILGTVSLDESIRSCDSDGHLDGDERGLVTIDISNASPSTAVNASITITSSTAGVTFPAGNQLTLGTLAAFDSTRVTFEIAVDPTSSGIGTLELVARLEAIDACETSITSTVTSRINFDEVGGLTVDTVETVMTPWTIEGVPGAEIWGRLEVEPLNHVWFGLDFPAISDTQLVSPAFTVSATSAFVISFDHAYEFEADTVFWDGGVIEVQRNGAAWEDVSQYLDPGYGGVLTNTSGNPLADREAFVATSSAFPNRLPMDLDFGTTFAGESVRIRFRIGSDAGAAFYGWEIDNIRVQGTTNAPFFGLSDDDTLCPIELIANAGPDLVADPGQIVVVDGEGVSSTNLPLTYAWTLLEGPNVTLVRPNTDKVIFTAPVSETASQLVLQLVVADGVRTATDTVVVDVRPAAEAVVTADAGADEDVEPNVLVVLDASNSRSTGTMPLTFTWTQTRGPAVVLSNPQAAVTRFTTPSPDTNEALSFQVLVSDGIHEDVDVVNINVRGSALNADAGADQAATSGARVVLDGSASNSSTNLPLTFSWAQISGPTAVVDGVDRSVLAVTAPEVEEDTTLEFELTVSDGVRTATDRVEVIVESTPLPGLVVNAGVDQAVDGAVTVVLDGAGSYSQGGRQITFEWSQRSGAGVTLSATDRPSVTFVAPTLKSLSVLEFTLSVDDGVQTLTDEVIVTVRGSKAVDPDEDSEGCSCSTSNRTQNGSALLLVVFGAGALILRRRRLF